MKLEISRRASRQIEKIQGWWSENRAARSLFLDELVAAERQLRTNPELGSACSEQKSRAINMHLNDASVEIAGTYRGMSVSHFFNPATGVNVMLNPAGEYVSGWSLGAGQLESLLQSGSVR